LPFAFVRTYDSSDPQAGVLGFGWTHNYAMRVVERDATGVVIQMADGRQDSYTADGQTYRAPAGIYDRLIIAADERLVLITPGQIRYRFDRDGTLMSMSDRNNNTLALNYQAERLATIIDTVGRVFTFAYDDDGRLTQISDPLGRTVQYAYTADGDLGSVTDLRGATVAFDYDAQHRLTTVQVANPAVAPQPYAVLTNQYTNGRVSAQTDADGFSVTFAYDYPTGRTTVRNERNHPTLYSFDAGYRVNGIQDAAGHVIRYTYAANNDLVGLVDRRGYSWSFAYDAAGNLTTGTDPFGSTTSATYDAQNNPLTITDARQHDDTRLYRCRQSGDDHRRPQSDHAPQL
jgi:YD repeat-containing protein